ncbi:hypothetical protein J6590_062663 [Homalodisca vitripennis]|nr:hypothetical protein J6590_062663 [Homalodisca vitripennis]
MTLTFECLMCLCPADCRTRKVEGKVTRGRSESFGHSRSVVSAEQLLPNLGRCSHFQMLTDKYTICHEDYDGYYMTAYHIFHRFRQVSPLLTTSGCHSHMREHVHRPLR